MGCNHALKPDLIFQFYTPNYYTFLSSSFSQINMTRFIKETIENFTLQRYMAISGCKKTTQLAFMRFRKSLPSFTHFHHVLPKKVNVLKKNEDKENVRGTLCLFLHF